MSAYIERIVVPTPGRVKPYRYVYIRRLKCASCGCEFIGSDARSRCDECSPKEWKSRKFGKMDVRCKVCGTQFTPHAGYREKTCSKACENVDKSTRQQGARSHLWQGGKTAQVVIERSSARYGVWRRAVFERDDYSCQICFVRGGKLCAHHRKRWATHPELRYDVDNGIALCWACHASLVNHYEPVYDLLFTVREALHLPPEELTGSHRRALASQIVISVGSSDAEVEQAVTAARSAAEAWI